MKRCEQCGEPFEPNSRGRPRKFCPDCASPEAAGRRWRERHAEEVAAYNAARRVKHEPRPCIECGELFTPGRVDGRLCSDRCRQRHRYRSSPRFMRKYGGRGFFSR